MKKILVNILCLMLVAPFGWQLIDPALLLAQSDDDTVLVTLDVTSGIEISSPVDVNMAPLGIANNESTGAAMWNVRTNDVDGYTLAVHSVTDPAMRDSVTSEEFTDYSEATSGTPEVWSVSNAYEFGFSAYGDDVADGVWGAGSSCGAATTIPANLNYRGFTGTTGIQVASDPAPTTTAGVNSTVCFAAEQETVFAPSGSYTATIVATATVQ